MRAASLAVLIVAVVLAACGEHVAGSGLAPSRDAPAGASSDSERAADPERRRADRSTPAAPTDAARGAAWCAALEEAGRSRSARDALKGAMESAGGGGVAALRWMVVHGDATAQRYALERLFEMEPCPAVALPEVSVAVRDPHDNVKIFAARTLAASLHPSVADEVYALAASDDETLAAVVVRELPAWAHDGDERAFELLLRLARSAPDDAQDAAIIGLRGFSKRAEVVVPILIALLDDDDEPHDWEVIETLAAMGEAATPAAPSVLRAMQAHETAEDEWETANPGVTSCGPSFSIRAMSTLEAMSPGAVPVMIAALGSGHDDVRWEIERSLGEFGLAAVPALRAALRSGSAGVRRSAATALGNMDEPPADVAPDLERVLSDADKAVAVSATAALGKLGEAGWPGLRTALTDKRLASVAVYALRRQRTAAPAFLGPVMRRMDEGDERFASAAVETLGSWGGAAAPAAGHVVPRLVVATGYQREQTVETLVRMGEGAIPALVEAAAGEDPQLAVAALDVLARTSAPADVVRPVALRMLADDEFDVRLVAALYLSRTAEAAASVVPVLREATTRRLPSGGATEMAARIAAGLDAYGHADPADLRAVLAALSQAARSDFENGYIGFGADKEIETLVRVLAAFGRRHPRMLVAALSEAECDGERWRLHSAIARAGVATAPFLLERAALGGEVGVEVVEVMSDLAKADEEARPAARSLRAAEDPLVRAEALGAFQSLGDAPADVLEPLVVLLESEPDGPARERAAAVLAWRIQAAAAPEAERIEKVRDVTGSADIRRLLDTCLERIEAR